MASKLSLPPLSPAKDPAAYPLFKGEISRFVWGFFTQRLTNPGRWFAIVTAIFIAYGGATLQLQGYVIAVYASMLWLIALAAMFFYRPRVKVTAHLAERVCAGQTLPVDVEVEQLSSFRGADLVVLPHRLPAQIDAAEEFGVGLKDLSRGERARVRLGLTCARRGAFALHGFRVETGFPFSILRTRRVFRQEHRLLVYPAFSKLARLNLPTGRRYQPGGVALASQLGESFEYLGNREFREGDNVRDIDWRATARNGGQMKQPIVREWVEEYMLRVAVVLDTHVPSKGSGFRVRGSAKAKKTSNPFFPRQRLRGKTPYPSPNFLTPEPRTLNPSFERAVSVAASVSDYMARQDYLVDIFAAGPNLYHLTAGRSLAYLDQILDILAVVESTDEEPFGRIEPELAEILSRISTVICVFLDYDENRRAFVQRLVQQGAAVKIILVRDDAPALDISDVRDVDPITVVDSAMFAKGVQEL